MKKYLLLVFILFSSIYVSYSQQGYGSNQNAGNGFSYLGTAFGNNNIILGQYAFIGGSNSQATGSHSFGFGLNVSSVADYSFAMGNHVMASGDFAWIIGSGYGENGEYKTARNIINNSLMMGFNMGDIPSFFVEPFKMNGSGGFVGIHTIAPRSTFDVNGILTIDGFVMPTGWQPNYVLTASGITGEAVWAELPAGGGGTYVHPNHTGQVVSDGDGNTSLTVQAIDAQTGVSTISGTDEIIFSNGLYLKKTNISVLESYMQTNLDFGDGGGSGIIGDGFWSLSPEVGVKDIYYDFGSVGIGTDTPDEALHVTGTIKTEGGLLMEGGRNNITFGSDQSSTFHIIRNVGTTPSKIFNISAEDKVGIGVLVAEEELHVNGNVLVEDDIHANANISADGNINTGGNLSIANTNSQLFFGKDGFPSSFSLIKNAGSTPGKDQDDIEILTVGENNFVGILTEGEPGAELEVNGKIILKEELKFNNDFDAQIAFGKSSSTKKFKILSLSTVPPPDPVDKSAFRGICLDAYGNLGIGIDNPSADLDVSGKTKTDYLQISNNGGVDKILRSDASGNASWVEMNSLEGAWQSDGAGNVYRQDGLVSIGTTPVEGYALAVNGSINAKLIKVTGTVPESDYVFEEDYSLMALNELETYVKTNKHLPEVMSAEEFAKDGYSLGEMDDILLRKVEELTLYVIDQDKAINKQQEIFDQQKQLLEKQQKLIDQLLDDK